MNDQLFRFYFGTAQESIADIQRKLELQTIVVLQQTHSIQGHVIGENNYHVPPFFLEGDFLVTNVSRVGLGVRTADCMPIIFIDTKKNVVGIAHAGWRGSVNNIVLELLQCMQKKYEISVADISVIFGPCAHVCCYQVGKDFEQNLKAFTFGKDSLVQRDNKLFFNMPFFNEQILLSAGLQKNAIRYEYSRCTICDENYFSFRRQGDSAGRQMSVVAIL